MVDQERKTPNWDHQKLHSEGVVVTIVGGLELDVDQVNRGICTTNVNDLKCGMRMRQFN